MVDDNQAELWLAQECFSEAGLPHPFVVFTSGQAFLTFVSEAKQGKVPWPYVVLIDINMGEMNGFELLTALRNDVDFWPAVPLVAFSNSRNPADYERAVVCGASSAQQKPDSLDDYVELFRELPRLAGYGA